MIIFARAPGTTGWVEIKPEEESSHRGQFWEIRKFSVESDGIMPLARRLDRAEQALRAAGFQYHGPSEKWLPAKRATPVPMEAIGKILAEVMEQAVKNGADSRSMPDDYVAVAHFTCYPEEYAIKAPGGVT